MMVKLSIIVPIYNVEKYIERCLNSIVNNMGFQENCELIIVNDGTKDHSEDIARKLIGHMSNACIISQCNQGLSVARNCGMKKAQGEYVWFIDSDDWIERDSISTLVKYLDGKNDMIQFGYAFAYDNKEKKIVARKTALLTGNDALVNSDWPMGAQFSIYRRKFIEENELTFYKGIFHEDNEFTPRAIYLAKRIRILNSFIYNYYQGNQNSILSVPNIKKSYDLMFVSGRTVSFVNKCVDDSNARKFLLNLAASEFNTSLRAIAKNDFENGKKREFLKSVDKKLILQFYRCTKLRYVFMAFCCHLSVNFYVRLLKLL